ncbi:bifunctional 4-hydroxy-2-oxoglutarate aldolase/2-dehydro-3-deoxy-phosphogluconate aldolase [Niallia sp.]|uniref:bifunctional 4-hydroxy-2-oxoglutarate aldolase/2-dehydro-3-deoxy-phosphogluconate aldolase n=1 Tax=Niallia sp. TaxID=2837523 RepID=UPI002898F55C|nr:bifunctional 4-hydroxy-2-oxoglutarate aldolase/2-dehydro-3-deoxy-phosphogluconate aldolase [Niallia sp.]
MESVLQTLGQEKIISAIRIQTGEYISQIVESLYNGGVKVIEITMNTPNALKHIEKIKIDFPDVLIGVGTVLDEETTRSAISAGASFILSPTLHEASMKMANRYNVPFIPGVLTPTEVLQAYEYGAKVVKIFPISSLGPKYIKDLKAPLAHIDMIPMGGITVANASEFLKAGSFALGIGSTLVNDKLIKDLNFEEIERRAKQLVNTVQTYENAITTTL